MTRIKNAKPARNKAGGSKMSALLVFGTIVAIMAVLFTSLPAGEAGDGSIGEPEQLPRQWVWERDAITFDHMYSSR